jgi:hypothetical protein
MIPSAFPDCCDGCIFAFAALIFRYSVSCAYFSAASARTFEGTGFARFDVSASRRRNMHSGG